MSLLALKQKSHKVSTQAILGLAGPVVAETKNTLTLIHQGQPKSVIKDLATFDFSFEDGTTVEIDGTLLVGRSEDRLKKSMKRLW